MDLDYNNYLFLEIIFFYHIFLMILVIYLMNEIVFLVRNYLEIYIHFLFVFYYFVNFEDIDFSITITIGVEEFDFSSPLEELLKKADEKLYMGKEAGRNRVVV